jgi:hypothetical protein
MAVLAASALLAGCGSTVSSAQRQAAARAGLTSDGVTNASGELVTGDTVAGDGGTAAAGGNGSSGAAASAARKTAATTRSGGAASSGAVGPGVTNDAINVGLAYAVNAGAANAALGASGISQGDAKTEYQIVIDDINAHGGVAGRKIVPIFHEVDGASTATTAAIAQQACDDWTQDHHVFVIFSAGDDTIEQCAHNRGALLISGDLTGADAATFRRFPYYVELSSMNLDRVATTEIAGINAQGYFSGWNAATGGATPTPAKVGILTFDDPAFAHATDQSMVPALKALGFAPDPADIVRVQTVQRTSDTGPIAAAVSSAVLKFRSDNVSHVLIFDERGLLSLLFMQNADSQRYFPRYGLNTQNGPQALADGAGLPKRQLIGSKGIGWLPSLDITPSQNTLNGPYSNDARRKCINLMTSKGISFADANAESIAMGICNEFWFFRDAMKLSGNVMNRIGFMDGVAKVGTSFQSNSVFATKFTASQHDGVSAVRYYVYDPGCTCMKYASANIAS